MERMDLKLVLKRSQGLEGAKRIHHEKWGHLYMAIRRLIAYKALPSRGYVRKVCALFLRYLAGWQRHVAQHNLRAFRRLVAKPGTPR